MGNCNITDKKEFSESQNLSVNNFEFIEVLGKGGFGKVWKVKRRKNKSYFALKMMSKAKIIGKKSVTSVMNERALLCQLRHPSLINLVGAFQDRENLYLVMDLLSGGDLRYHIGKNKKFSEAETKFFCACIIIALEYLHSQGIIHRDLKPENLVFDSEGYLRLTDLGIARIWRPDNSADTSGTPGYMAPEVLCRQNHGIAVDYFALGVIVYECMMGRRPYVGRSRQEIRDNVLAKQVQIKKNEVPTTWSLEAADFANQLIQRKPAQRLGSDNPEAVKNHKWFDGFEWNKLLNRQLQPPYLPHNYSSSDGSTKDTEQDTKENNIMLRRNSIQAQFEGYSHDPNELISAELTKL
ncbi:unnamed protein product (macronuclear) [Paramecium tetraurelia]|uniref:Protein kinase domain-containing protein n=1 Tax=Paramecium tetraurelia TaxID=5888 RepID=A0DE77_PARTE|nr:uncharacterized protein GSPATT00016186001 [Paramecium tetraurelia]CAK81344.1 unnamed protein product [Paramecium tetraurelia]|eukprot:XP_001448741.1 hypothetical protein (macronuclear) [Paramecium tetraurelia strain d4-2]